MSHHDWLIKKTVLWVKTLEVMLYTSNTVQVLCWLFFLISLFILVSFLFKFLIKTYLCVCVGEYSVVCVCLCVMFVPVYV